MIKTAYNLLIVYNECRKEKRFMQEFTDLKISKVAPPKINKKAFRYLENNAPKEARCLLNKLKENIPQLKKYQKLELEGDKLSWEHRVYKSQTYAFLQKAINGIERRAS